MPQQRHRPNLAGAVALVPAGFAAVVYGHSHRPAIETRGGVLYLNFEKMTGRLLPADSMTAKKWRAMRIAPSSSAKLCSNGYIGSTSNGPDRDLALTCTLETKRNASSDDRFAHMWV